MTGTDDSWAVRPAAHNRPDAFSPAILHRVPPPCRWIALEDLHTVDLKPAFLKSALPEWDGKLLHIHLEK